LDLGLEDEATIQQHFVSNKAFFGLELEDEAIIKSHFISHKVFLGLGPEDGAKIKHVLLHFAKFGTTLGP